MEEGHIDDSGRRSGEVKEYREEEVIVVAEVQTENEEMDINYICTTEKKMQNGEEDRERGSKADHQQQQSSEKEEVFSANTAATIKLKSVKEVTYLKTEGDSEPRGYL